MVFCSDADGDINDGIGCGEEKIHCGGMENPLVFQEKAGALLVSVFK